MLERRCRSAGRDCANGTRDHGGSHDDRRPSRPHHTTHDGGAGAAGPTLGFVTQLIADSVASGSYVVENPDTPGVITGFYDDTFVYDPAAGTASIEFCRIGSDLRIEPGGNPGGSDRIINDEVNAYHERSDVELIDGRWYDAHGAVLQKFEGTTTCAGR